VTEAPRRARGLYVHVPFCARACPYCDFDFVVARRPDVEGYLAGLEREWMARGLAPGFSTVYVGGGTPSSLGPAGLARLLAWIAPRIGGTPSEWTVELNPEHVDDASLDALTGAGVDRISLGVQTFEHTGLHVLGRKHTAVAAQRAVERARARGLAVSIDLIVGWPGQSRAALERDLAWLDALGVRHVSVYALTIEPGTPWEALVRRGRRSVPDPDAQADALELVAERLAAWEHYEVASYARDGQRARHNLGYWRWADYVGLGPSAASARFEGGRVHRRTAIRGLADWLADPLAGEEEVLTGTRAAAEGLWTGLRCLEGVDLGPGSAFWTTFPAVDRAWVVARTADHVARGNLEWVADGAVLRVRPERWMWHDEVAAALLDDPATTTAENPC